MSWKNFRIRLLGWLLHFDFSDDGIFYFTTIIVGALTGFVAVFFHFALGWAHHVLFGSHDLSEIHRAWYWVAVIPAGGAFLSALFLQYFAPEARGSGIPQTKIAYVAHNGHIDKRVWIGKFLIGVLNIGSGSSLGREGPTVQICSGAASWIGETFSLKRRRVQALVPVGCAAALAAAFNTPIAAVTFTLEELVGDLNARVLGSIVFAAVSASVVSRAILGNEPVFSVPAYSLDSSLELLLYAFVGVVCAIVAVAFIKGLLFIRAGWKRLRGFRGMIATGLGGLFVGVIGIWVPEVFAVGYPAVSKALTHSYTLPFLLSLLVLKLIATAVSYGTGSLGGIFAPTLFMGAMAGGAVASLAELAFPGFVAHPGGYALVGMGAAFAAVIRAPMTSVLIIFELTQDYHIILALMVANAISLALARFWHPEPIYSALSSQDGVALPDHETEHLLHEIHVFDAMIRDVITLPEDITIQEAIERTRGSAITGYPVLNASGKLSGMASNYDFSQAQAAGILQKPLGEIAKKKYIMHAHPDQSLDSVMAKLGDRRISRLPVVSRVDPTEILGIITAEDVIHAFGKVWRGRQHHQHGAD